MYFRIPPLDINPARSKIIKYNAIDWPVRICNRSHRSLAIIHILAPRPDSQPTRTHWSRLNITPSKWSTNSRRQIGCLEGSSDATQGRREAGKSMFWLWTAAGDDSVCGQITKYQLINYIWMVAFKFSCNHSVVFYILGCSFNTSNVPMLSSDVK